MPLSYLMASLVLDKGTPSTSRLNFASDFILTKKQVGLKGQRGNKKQFFVSLHWLCMGFGRGGEWTS